MLRAAGTRQRRSYPDSAGLLAPQLEPLLLAIQEQQLYADSKTAVDLVLKAPAADVAAGFARLGSAGSDATALQQFVNASLAPAGSDLQQCQPSDWVPEPPGFLANLTRAAVAAGGGSGDSGFDAAAMRQFGLQLHGLWSLLCRQVSPDVAQQPERHSLLPLPNRTIVPGDRFRETYYWDSAWVLRGLLVSRMHTSAAGLVGNLLSMLEHVGHVPNGARVYYLNRSQPPLLSVMVRDLYEATSGNSSTLPAASAGSSCCSSSSSSSPGDMSLLQRALPLLLAEHAYWSSPPKAVTIEAADGSRHNLSRYWADWRRPRPESYREDAALAAQATGNASPQHAPAAALYHELASGAESGWDFSSRWLADNATLATIRTTQVIPADLNAFLFQMETNIAWAARLTGDAATAGAFEAAAAARRAAMAALLWDEAAGMWRDGILAAGNDTASAGGLGAVHRLRQSHGMFASNFVPLWAGLTEGDDAQGARVVAALQRSGLVGPSGVGTTLYATGQQWDWPNGWPPLQHMIIEGAHRYGGPAGRDFARTLARTWVSMNAALFVSSGHMHEKYNVSSPGGAVGGGGEYAPQVGFGWSNGVALDLLARYVV